MRSKKKFFNAKKSLLAGTVIIFSMVSVSLIIGSNTKSLPHRNPIDTKISQYSDKHITQNAIVTNLKFKDIAFETSTPQRPTFFSNFSNQMAAVAKIIKSITAPKAEEGPKEYGTWIWTPVMSMTPEYMESILSDAKVDGVNTIYISVDTYLDIFTMAKGENRNKQKEVFGNKLEDFINMANSKGIQVDAEAGWRNWAEGDNTYKAFAIVNYVKNFNATRKSQFRGFQYDVEPYLLDSYNENKSAVLKDFVALIDKTQNFMGTSTLRFSVVVPDFYDGKDEMTPRFSYNQKSSYAFEHLLNILDKRVDSSIIIMSYRSFADGYDGSIEISRNEIQTAKDGRYNTKIIIAQETGDVPPPYITFNKTSKKYMARQINSINNAFQPYSNFAGIAVHYVNAFLALK